MRSPVTISLAGLVREREPGKRYGAKEQQKEIIITAPPAWHMAEAFTATVVSDRDTKFHFFGKNVLETEVI